MTYRLIAAEKEHHPVSLLCRVLRVSRSGFYAWLRRGGPNWRSPRFRSDQHLLAWIAGSTPAPARPTARLGSTPSLATKACGWQEARGAAHAPRRP